MKGDLELSRKQFLAGALGAPAVLQAAAPNDVIGIGHIGVGTRGGDLVKQVVKSIGANNVLKDGREVPDTTHTVFQWEEQGRTDAVRDRHKPKCNEDDAYIESITFIMSIVSYMERRQVRWDPVRQEIV